MDLPHLSAAVNVSMANTSTLLIKASATVTVYRKHHQTLFFLPRNISLFIMCIGIVRNNSLVGGRALAEVWTLAAERITLYCTWRPRALTTGPHGQVYIGGSRLDEYIRHWEGWQAGNVATFSDVPALGTVQLKQVSMQEITTVVISCV